MKVPRQSRRVTVIHPDIVDLYEVFSRVINGRIAFGNPTDGRDNIDGVWYSGTTPVGADTEFSVTHNLGRVPVGYLTVYLDKAAIVYKGAVAWTAETISLKCSAASVAVRLFVF